LFEDKDTLPLKCTLKSLNVLNDYPHVQEKSVSHMQGEVAINKDIPRAFSYGASQGNPFKGVS
jgi:hypothetical protein